MKIFIHYNPSTVPEESHKTLKGTRTGFNTLILKVLTLAHSP